MTSRWARVLAPSADDLADAGLAKPDDRRDVRQRKPARGCLADGLVAVVAKLLDLTVELALAALELARGRDQLALCVGRSGLAGAGDRGMMAD